MRLMIEPVISTRCVAGAVWASTAVLRPSKVRADAKGVSFKGISPGLGLVQAHGQRIVTRR
jgi:hypothetical protein